MEPSLTTFTKSIGKLRKGVYFKFYQQDQVYKVTASGYGRPFVEFEKHPVPDGTYSTCQKRDTVEVIVKSFTSR